MNHPIATPDHRLPIKLDAASNGEYAPIPLDAVERGARQAALAQADAHARRLGTSRRAYLTSVCGAAATLGAFDAAFAVAGRSAPHRGQFAVPADAAFEPTLAQATVGGDEFVFDVQLHHVNPAGAWRRQPGWEPALRNMPHAACGESDPVACFSRERLLKDVFLDSDTAVAVLSHVPGLVGNNPLEHDEALATKRLIDALDGTERLLLHARVHPNAPGEIERMAEHAGSTRLAGFKTYTQFAPPGDSSGGFFLDDERYGRPMIERARALGVRNICVHKGIPLSPRGVAFAGCRDIGVVARAYPDMNFIVYHAGFFPQRSEGPYDAARPSGVDELVDSLRANGVASNANVYAELGSTWRMLMRQPVQAAHLLGKLLQHVGEHNVLWGTDCLWYGSPQDQIQAFRAFRIGDELIERHGYPELTPERKRAVLGLNGARVYGLDVAKLAPRLKRDRVQRARVEYAPHADPSFETLGPRNRREFLAFKRAEAELSAAGG